MILVCKQICLSLKLANSLNPEFTLTLQGCYIITMNSQLSKRQLTFSKRLGRQFILLKKSPFRWVKANNFNCK